MRVRKMKERPPRQIAALNAPYIAAENNSYPASKKQAFRPDELGRGQVLRALELLHRVPAISREQLDEAVDATNSPGLVHTLRGLGVAIRTQRVKPWGRAIYSLDPSAITAAEVVLCTLRSAKP
jgi:hypothetical protein